VIPLTSPVSPAKAGAQIEPRTPGELMERISDQPSLSRMNLGPGFRRGNGEGWMWADIQT
jgi:hypothetical protein